MGRLGRAACAWIGAVLGFYVAVAALGVLARAYPAPPAPSAAEATLLVAVVSAVGGAAGWRLGPACVVGLRQAARALVRALEVVPLEAAFAALTGVLLGLLAGFLLAPSLARIPGLGPYLTVAASLALAWLGAALLVRRRSEWVLFLQSLRGGRDRVPPAPGRPKVLDTSAVIDGRVLDLARTGFLEGELVVPTWVLDELRRIADSPEPVRRQRGRHGLEVLANLQKELGGRVVVTDQDPAPGQDVDHRLVLLAKALGAEVVSTDANLDKVAELQGVTVLNVNELASVLRPQYLPGEALAVRIVADGKQPGQGVGYLVDGTMVVVEGGRRFMNEEVEVEVTSSYQTAQGRMLFGRPRERRLERVGRA